MKLKDLYQSTKTVGSSSLDDIASEVESQEYVKSFHKDKKRFLPNVDYSDPKNFAFFGSAEKYYTDAFVRIRNQYPYDGSFKEKFDWQNDSTFLDMYIFEHRYPRFNGYVNMGYPTWGTLSGSLISGYGKSNTDTYIKVFGGPHQSDKDGLVKQFPHANKLDNAKVRESNLQFKLDDGVTIEMWLKKPAFSTAKTEKEVLFDLWNGEASGSAQYGRLRLELTGASSGSPFLLTALSGTGGSKKGVQNQSLGTNLTTASISDWTHVALSLKNSGSDIQTNLYINGALNQRQTLSNAAMGDVTGSLISFIGALQTAPSGSPTIQAGAGKLSGSIDEFRYWKTERSSKDIGRYYWTNFGGGTNNDEANTNLGVYYKFNEGITQTSSIDSTVLDYSGRLSNGTWAGYETGARSTDSAIVLSKAAKSEFKDPTIYSSHPDYISTLIELEKSGSLHDIENNASLFNGMPSWILEEDDEKEGNLRNLTQVMGSFFDNMYLYVQEVNSLKDVYSHFQTKILEEEQKDGVKTTSITGSVKPLPFADRLLTNAGFVAPELFADATVLEALASRSEDEHYEMKLHDVKNQIYQNVYAVLTATYKEKGSMKAFRNVLHAFGIDEDVVKINMHGDNVDFEIGDKHNIRARKEKFVDFNHPDRFNGSIYQYASGTNGVSFISGSGGNFEKYIPVTFETQVILPNKIPYNEVNGFETPFTKSVIAGMHEADPADGTVYTIPSSDLCGLQIYSERDQKESKRVKFHLSSSALGINLSSSYYKDQYLNNEWLFAFKIRNERYSNPDMISGSSASSNYIVDFIGYNTEANTVLNSFHKTATVDRTKAHSFLNKSKRIYAGAKRQNFTGSIQEPSDHKIGFVRYWMSDLSKDVLLNHANDSTNYGTLSPFRSSYLMENDVNDIKIPEIDTLMLHWDFEVLSTSDASGQFISLDVTSGSGEERYMPAFESIKRKFYHGRGDFFLANDNKVIDVDYINASRITAPELLAGDDMIEIRTQDDIQFTKNTLPQDFFIAFEKSIAQTISEEMINYMSSITAFNELIGRPVDRYRMEYKDLTKLRQLFFEKITGDIDLDKYIDYYKWLDDALGEMLVALVPASIKHSDGVNNVIENHLFDRDKYHHKFPTMEFITPDLEGGMNTINRHLYPWKTGHAPAELGGGEDDNCFWWLERAERTATGNVAIQPSQLPANSIHVTAEGDILYNFSEAVSRVQIDLLGVQYTGVSQDSGTATSAWSPAHTPNVGGVKRIILFQSGGPSDFSNNIPAGSGILIRLTGMTVMPTGEFGTDPVNSNYFRNSNASGRLTITYASLESLGSSTPSVNNNAGVLNTRQRVFQARNSVLRRSFTTAQHFAVDESRQLHGGTNYEPNKRRDYIWSAARDASESPIDYGKFGGFPLRYVLVNNDMLMALKDCDDERPVTEKLKRAFGAIDGFDMFHHYFTGSDDGLKKGGMVVPFNIMSSSVTTGYTAEVEGKPGFENNINIVNLHSDTVDNSNAIPMQGPFTERWVGGHQSRHAPINRATTVGGDIVLDNTSSRGEGYKILINHIENVSGSIGIAGPDYPHPYSSRTEVPHMYLPQAKARYFREERAKRPLNIRNILTSGSQVGNYQKNYQVVHTFGRFIQKSILNDLAATAQLHNATNVRLPQTTQEASLVARGTGTKGNTMSNFNTSSLYLGDVKTSKATYADHEASGSGDSIIVNRFSAPGGFETMSEVFLDLYSKEKSSYNALPFRNLQIRGSGSGEAGTVRLIDIHGNRFGLLTHLTRHSAQFGIDSVLGGANPSYHKVNRNSKWDVGEEAYDRDNYWIQHPIPQSDFQYKWVKSSHTASLATSSYLRRHTLSSMTLPSGTTGSLYPEDHIDHVTSQSILNINRAGTPTLLSSTMDQTPYGYPSWEQIRNNDRNINIQSKKSYGYNFVRRFRTTDPDPSGNIVKATLTVDESRVTENIPNTAHVHYHDSLFEFQYPYVNMKYHFDNANLSNTGEVPLISAQYPIQHNQTMYRTLYGYYSGQNLNARMHVTAKNIKQILFPMYIKHTKFFVRHRHFFASHFWTDGENDRYQTDINETGSYFRVDEVGRREVPVTAALWATENLDTNTINLISQGKLTNIIPSQSIWSMDSRTYFDGTNAPAGITGLSSTGWDHHIAASNSIGAPGVLQNQDHHFHNGTSSIQLLRSGSAASGSFKLRGATRFGSASSGSFTVHGVMPTGVKASGSFQVTSSNTQGSSGTGQFTSIGKFTPAQSSSFQFTANGRTVLAQPATAIFRVSGAYAPPAKSTGSFVVTDTREFTAATSATASFTVKGAYHPPTLPEATFQIGGISVQGTLSQATFTLEDYNDNGWNDQDALTIFKLHLGNTDGSFDQNPTQLGGDHMTITFNNNAGVFNDPSVSTAQSAFSLTSTKNVTIVPGSFSSNTNFWNHVKNIFKNMSKASSQGGSNRSFQCSRSGANFTVTTAAGIFGRGNTYFMQEDSDTGNCITGLTNTGGAAARGCQDQQTIRIPYFSFSNAQFRTASFEVDTSTGGTPSLANVGFIALPALSSSQQSWHPASFGTINSDTTLFNAISGALSGTDGGEFGQNYEISYDTAGTPASNPVATFKLKLRAQAVTDANNQDNTIGSSSWDNLALTGVETTLPNVDFGQFKAECGSKENDEIRFTVNGTQKSFLIASNSSGVDGNTTKIDAYGGLAVGETKNNNFFSALQTAIGNVLPSGFSVSRNASGAGNGDECDDTSTYIIKKTAAGSYAFGLATVTNTGNSFSSVSNTNGTDAFGFGSTGTGNANKLVIGGTDVAEAHASNNTGINVDRTQTQANIVSNIISSVQSVYSGYNITSHAQGNGHEFRITASANGVVNNRTMTANGQFTSNGAIAGGLDTGGSQDGHTLQLGSKNIILDDDDTADTATNIYVQIDGVNDTTFWGNLATAINSTDFTVVSTSDNAGIRTFNIRADTPGTAGNSLTVASSDASFDVTQTPTGGTNETGATDGHYISWFATSLNAHGYQLVVDRDNAVATSTNETSSVAESGFTTIHVRSQRSSDTDFWNSIKAAIEAEGSGSGNSPAFDASYTVNAGQATFTVTNYITGAAGNGGGSGNGVTSGGTFQKLAPHKFSGGGAASGAQAGDTITIHGQTITVTHGTADHANRIVDASGSSLTDAQYWEAIRTVINANVDDVTATRVDGVFTVTTTATGSSQNPAISGETGNTFTINNAGTNGTDETGAENGDTITIDGHTVSINIGSGLGTGSNSAFHNALSKSIKDNTDFDTITIDSESGGYFKFNLTSSVTGTAKNVSFQQNSNGTRATFQNLVGAAGGTTPVGIGDLDAIKITNAASAVKTFTVDTQGDGAGSSQTNPIYIDISSLSGTDSEKSTAFWNALSASIKSNTDFDTITITPDASNNEAVFSITSSVTGTAYNSNITQVYNPDGGPGFTITNNTAGGVNESGATAGDTLAVSNSSGVTTFTIVNNSSPSALQINAGTAGSPISDTQFFNNMTAAWIANTDYDIIAYTEASDTGSFVFTSSNGSTDPFTGQNFLTGVAYNGSMTENGNAFTNLVGPAGGRDGTFSNVKFLEIIAQPRYNYPMALTSPGSLRCPTDKSHLGLIHQVQTLPDVYKLRSNHFALTRSLGHHTDGLYDNTSRWTTPDLSGLVPFDDEYDKYYERHRGHNKHHALVPEFRISSHVKKLLDTGEDETTFFQENYWLELTGASFDDGTSVAINNDAGLARFNAEFASTNKIRNMENFVIENIDNPDVGLAPIAVTLTCDAIKSFLPYEGFYPQTRTVQMAEAFADSYGSKISAAEADPSDTTLSFPDNNVFAQARPIYDAICSPGLLYNTIKSGIAVDYPIISSKMATSSVKDPYGGTNYMVANEYFEERLPFETLLNPPRHAAKKFIVDLHPHPSSSMNLKAQLTGEENANYRAMAQNFFAESLNFFLQKRSTSRIISKPDGDPSFGIVPTPKVGKLPVYRSIFKVYKSKKTHPYVEVSGTQNILAIAAEPEHVLDLISNRPPSGTNYFLSEYAGFTGSALQYELHECDYPRPNYNPNIEVGSITMYSQPNAFGPPCAGGVSVFFSSINGEGETLTADNNNTSYMMYDSTNGYNAPYTPPYYDGEAWAIYTFQPQRAGKHTLDEILANTTVDFLRYEINHESGAFGDRGTFGPQGFSMNDNAMQVDASFNLFKTGLVRAGFGQGGGVIVQDTELPGGVTPQSKGKAWIIESKFETPILDFSKYLNRHYNRIFEDDVTSFDIFTGSMSLSGTRAETDILSSVDSALASVHELSGIMNPIGMWHQYGNHPKEADRGIFMQITDLPRDYILNGTEMTIPNPKYATVIPEVESCDGTGLESAYNQNPETTMIPYVKRQLNKRRLSGGSEFSVVGGAMQVLNFEDEIILDTELRKKDLEATFNMTMSSNSDVVEKFKFFRVFRDPSNLSKNVLTTTADFTASTQLLKVKIDNTNSSGYNASSLSTFKGHWAASYYHKDKPNNYAPLMILTKNINALSYDFGEFSKGFFEDFLKDFSIGIQYSKQSPKFQDAEQVDCIDSTITNRGVVFAPKAVTVYIDSLNKTLSAGSLSKIDMSQGGITKVLQTDTLEVGTSPVATIVTPESKLINASIKQAQSTKTSYKSLGTVRKVFKLIPPCPSVSEAPSTPSTTYQNSIHAGLESLAEPQFVRGAIRFNAGHDLASSDTAQLTKDFVKTMPQFAPQNDNNITRNPSTVRWGRFMPERGEFQMTKSLADLVGFSQDPVKMGVTAKYREVREAVVAIPFIQKFTVSNPMSPFTYQNAVDGDINAEYLTLDKDLIMNYLLQKGIITADRTPSDGVGAPEEEIILDPAVENQIKQMQNYVFPPHIDFINYDVQPLPMYIFEYSKDLSRNDLTSIWQGVATEELKKVEMEEKSITHNLSLDSLLGQIKQDTPNMLNMKDLRWRVFKVKQKAQNNYEEKMVRDLFNEGFIPSEVTPISRPPFGYNWPYDYFSLVENAQIKIDIRLQKPIDNKIVVPGGEGGGGTSDSSEQSDSMIPEGFTVLEAPVEFGSANPDPTEPSTEGGNFKSHVRIELSESTIPFLTDVVYGGFGGDDGGGGTGGGGGGGRGEAGFPEDPGTSTGTGTTQSDGGGNTYGGGGGGGSGDSGVSDSFGVGGGGGGGSGGSSGY